MSRHSQSVHEAVRLLTTLSMRPDLSCSLSEDHMALQEDYSRLSALENQRAKLAEQMRDLERNTERARTALSRRVETARFGLQAQLASLALGRAA